MAAAATRRIERAAPFLFLGLWSGGYTFAKLALADASPLLALALRFSVSLLIFAAIAAALRAPWPRGPREWLPIAATGGLIQAAYFTGCYLAFADGVAAGAMAMLLALQPILTALLAGPLLGERVRRVQWLGLLLGLAGVALVVGERLGAGVGTPRGVLWGGVALAAITAGTLVQKRFCPRFDLWTGGVVQYVTATLIVVPLAALAETPRLVLTGAFLGAMGYLVLANSVVSVSLLNLMIRKGEAARVTSLLYLVPGVASLIAWAVLGERLSPAGLAGLAVGALGVALVMRPALRTGPP